MKKRRSAFYWRYRLKGKEVWIPLGSDPETARRRLRELKREGKVHRSELTVLDLAKRWLEVYVATSRSEKNQRLAAVRVERYVQPFFSGMRASGLAAADLRAYRLFLEGRRISAQTVKHVLSDARCLLRWAEDEGWIDRSPFPRRVMPRVQERPPDRLSDSEIRHLVVLEDPFGYIVRLGLETGLRWGELTRVRAEDYERGMLVVSRTKSGRVRRVPCSRELVEGRVGLLVGGRDASVFARAVRRRSDVVHFHPHQLRHTMACRWLERGGSLAALQEILGHASITTTQRYARLLEPHVRAEAARVGEHPETKIG